MVSLVLERILAYLTDIERVHHNFDANWIDVDLFSDICYHLKGLGQCKLLLACNMTF